MLDIYSCYSKYSGLNHNLAKCEIAWIGSLKVVEVVFCDITCVNLKVNCIEILGIHFSYVTKLNIEKKNLTAISNIFKTLTLSKIVYLCLTSVVPKQIIEEIENIQKNLRSEPVNFEK